MGDTSDEASVGVQDAVNDRDVPVDRAVVDLSVHSGLYRPAVGDARPRVSSVGHAGDVEDHNER